MKKPRTHEQVQARLFALCDQRLRLVSRKTIKRRPAASSPEYAQQQRCQKDHDEDEEQDLRNLGCATRDSAEAKKRRDDRDDEKDDSVSKHEALQRVDYRIGLRAGLTPSPP
jgi:hypothetical protein